MNNENYLEPVKKMERKKFFVNAGKGFMGILFLSSFPFNLFSRNNSSSKRVEIKINPLSVSREKNRIKNV